jgi:hypothetical protein
MIGQRPSEIFADFNKKSFVEGSIVNGVWVDGATAVTTILASVQPANGKDLLILPEGERLKAVIKIWTDETLAIASGKIKADQIQFNSEWYEVHNIKKNDLGIGHYEALAVKVN